MTGHGTSISNGNALVSIKDDSGEILWSWHLWFCKEDPRNSLDTYPETSSLVMNRALGATRKDSLNILSYNTSGILWPDCLFYQSGRKDPIRLDSSGKKYTDEKDDAVEFKKDWDTSIGWTTPDKSVNDPCPQGYQVPSTNIWKESNSGTLEKYTTTALAYTYNWSQKLTDYIFYPYTGHLDSNGDFIDNFVDENKTATYATGTDFAATLLYPTCDYKNNVRRRYRKIFCNVIDNGNESLLAAAKNYALNYGFDKSGFTIISCQYDEGTPRLFSTSWKNDWKDIKVEDLTDDEKEAIIQNIQFRNGILSLSDDPIYDKNFIIPKAHAMPIRCVSSTSNRK